MILITITHTPGHHFASWVPAQWSVSDTADVFVVLAGLVAGMVFVPLARRRGFGAMLGRVLVRMRRIWLAQVVTVIAVVCLAVAIDQIPGLSRYYIDVFPLGSIFERPREALIGLVTLTWVPNVFDILPMYVFLMAMVPVLIAAHRIGGIWAVAGLVLGLYAAAQAGVNLPAQPWDREIGWFFNPLAWTLPFALAFAFGAGWIPAPRVTGGVALLALGYLLLFLPITFWPFSLGVWLPGGKEMLTPWVEWLTPVTAKSTHGILRTGSVFAVLALGIHLAGPKGARLREGVTAWPIPEARWIASLAALALVGMALIGSGLRLESLWVGHATAVVSFGAAMVLIWCALGADLRGHVARHAPPRVAERLARIGRNSLGCFIVSTPIALLGALFIELTGGGFWVALVLTILFFMVFDGLSAVLERAPERVALPAKGWGRP